MDDLQRQPPEAGTAVVNFGEHFMLDGYGGDPARLDDGELIKSSIAEICTIIGMHPLGPLQIVRAPDNQLKDPGGWSAIQLIAESHIAIHTFPRRRFVSADIYSCKNGMDLAALERVLTRDFMLAEAETHFVRRGVRYPARNLV